MWRYKLRNRWLSATMEQREKLAIFIANILSREIAYWTFIRVVGEGCEEYPGEQKVSDVQARWIRNTPL